MIRLELNQPGQSEPRLKTVRLVEIYSSINESPVRSLKWVFFNHFVILKARFLKLLNLKKVIVSEKDLKNLKAIGFYVGILGIYASIIDTFWNAILIAVG